MKVYLLNAELPLLTASRMRCFRACPRLHQLRYVEGWRPAVEAEALRVGTLVHAGLEAWWRGWMPPEAGCPGYDVDPLDLALGAVAGRAIDPYEQVRVEELLLGYDLCWREDAALYEVIAVEAEYRCPQLNPATLARSRTWELGGKIDAIARRREDGRVLVVEHKTTSEAISSDADHYWQTLALDGQISGYVLGAESLGHQVDEVLYDVIRKVGLRPLRATAPEARKWRQPKTVEEKTWHPQDARLLYTSQRLEDETPEEYRARVRAAIAEAPFEFFQRRAIPRTESQIRDYMQDAWQLGRAMRDMELDGHAPRNPSACHQYGTCAMWLVCSTGSHPSQFPAEYRQTDNVNPELSR